MHGLEIGLQRHRAETHLGVAEINDEQVRQVLLAGEFIPDRHPVGLLLADAERADFFLDQHGLERVRRERREGSGLQLLPCRLVKNLGCRQRRLLHRRLGLRNIGRTHAQPGRIAGTSPAARRSIVHGVAILLEADLFEDRAFQSSRLLDRGKIDRTRHGRELAREEQSESR